jgi:hypothetical protein
MQFLTESSPAASHRTARPARARVYSTQRTIDGLWPTRCHAAHYYYTRSHRLAAAWGAARGASAALLRRP